MERLEDGADELEASSESEPGSLAGAGAAESDDAGDAGMDALLSCACCSPGRWCAQPGPAAWPPALSGPCLAHRHETQVHGTAWQAHRVVTAQAGLPAGIAVCQLVGCCPCATDGPLGNPAAS